MSDIKIVKLFPIEVRWSGTKGHRRYPAIVWYRDLSISTRLNQEVINRIIKELETIGQVHTIENPDNILYWQYHNPLKPLIIIDMRELPPTINTTEGTIQHFGLKECQIQAAIVLQILKRYGYANYKRVTVSTWRLGETPEDRKKLYEAFEGIFRKGEYK